MRSDSPLPTSRRSEPEEKAPRPKRPKLLLPPPQPAARRARRPRGRKPVLPRGLTAECAGDVEWLRQDAGLTLREICYLADVPPSSLKAARSGLIGLAPEYVASLALLRAETRVAKTQRRIDIAEDAAAGRWRQGRLVEHVCLCCGATFSTRARRRHPDVCPACVSQARQVLRRGIEPCMRAALARVTRIRAARPRTS